MISQTTKLLGEKKKKLLYILIQKCIFLEIHAIQIFDQTLQLFKMLIIIKPESANFPSRGFLWLSYQS